METVGYLWLGISELASNAAYWLVWTINQNWFQPAVSTITIPILAWTALEGWRAAKEAARANYLRLAPVIGIYYHHLKAKGVSWFKIKNLGQGVAYDVEVEPWIFIAQDAQKIFICTMCKPGTNIIAPGEDRSITFEVEINGKRVADADMLMLEAMRSRGPEIVVGFKDAIGRKWWTKIKVSEGSIRIVAPPQLLGIGHRIGNWFGRYFLVGVTIVIEKFFWQFEEKSIRGVPNYMVRVINIPISIWKKLPR